MINIQKIIFVSTLSALTSMAGVLLSVGVLPFSPILQSIIGPVLIFGGLQILLRVPID